MLGEAVYGYLAAQTLIQVLRQCGDDLTRDNVMTQAANLKGLTLGMLLPGRADAKVCTSLHGGGATRSAHPLIS